MTELSGSDQTPLLSAHRDAQRSNNNDFGDSSTTLERGLGELLPDRSTENDVLLETAVQGRNLGWSSAYILIISRVIGSGIFATPGVIIKSVGSIGLALSLWVAGALISWFGLQISLEYGCMLPRSGGHKVYLEFTYRHPRFFASTMIAVQSVLLGFTASNCIVFADYILFALGREVSYFDQKALAVALLTTIIIMHSCFLKTGIFIQNFLGWIKIALIGVMIATSLFVLIFHSGNDDYDSNTASKSNNFIWKDSIWNWGSIATALFKVFYSYAGFENANNVMNEVKNPVRTLKSAAKTAILTVSVLYVLINIAYFLVVPIDDIKNSGELIAALFFERVFGHTLGRKLLPVAIACSVAGNVMVVTFSHARIIQEIGRQGFIPFSNFVSSTKPFNAPMGALIVHYIPSLLVILVPLKDVYTFILDVEGYPVQFFALALAVGILLLRSKRQDLNRPYKASLVAVWLRIALSLALIAAPFVPEKGATWRSHLAKVSYAFVGTSIFIFGVLYWYTWIVLIPKWGGYQLEEVTDILVDGTTVTKLARIPGGNVRANTLSAQNHDV